VRRTPWPRGQLRAGDAVHPLAPRSGKGWRETTARDEVFSDAEKFRALTEEFAREANTLARVAAAGDRTTVNEHFPEGRADLQVLPQPVSTNRLTALEKWMNALKKHRLIVATVALLVSGSSVTAQTPPAAGAAPAGPHSRGARRSNTARRSTKVVAGNFGPLSQAPRARPISSPRLRANRLHGSRRSRPSFGDAYPDISKEGKTRAPARHLE
jgi:hypothetical protein